MKRWNKLIAMTLIVMLLSAFAAPVMAAEINPDIKGSIQIVVRDLTTKQPVAGGSLALYQVANLVKAEDGTFKFVYTEDFAAYGAALDDQLAKQASAMAAYANKNNIAGDKSNVAQDGTASYTGLPLGLYLVVQIEKGDKNHSFNPFLVVLPTQTNDELRYSVIAAPKTGGSDPYYPPYNPPDNPPYNPPGDNPPGDNPPGDNPPVENPPEDFDEPDVPLGEIDIPIDLPIEIPGEPVPQAGLLPQTGQLWWPVPLMAVAGMICFAAGWKRRYEN